MSFGKQLISWYNKSKRDLPWRHTTDPFKIWLSEIILQQTRVEQGMPYYYKFIDAFPNVVSLANAPEDEVMKLWQGLGYYSRARNLHSAAKQIKDDFGGKFPTDYASIRSLKGVGDYTAAAIASFAYKLPYPVVDGNVYRVLSRHFGIEDAIDKPKSKAIFTSTAEGLMKGLPPDEFNQALMEFGAIQCKPGTPDCGVCPFNKTCFALKNDVINELPVKEKKMKVRSRYFHYFIIESKNGLAFKKRSKKDIWQGLYDFPLVETEENKNLSQSDKKLKNIFPEKISFQKISKEYKHVLSHQNIHAKFYHVKETMTLLSDNEEYIYVNKDELENVAVPRLVDIYLKEMG